jgi:hypothetical protein
MHTAWDPLIDDPVSSFTAYFDEDNSEVCTTSPLPCSPVAEPHKALNALQSLEVSQQSFYLDLRACAVASDPPALQQGHMDSGSMVCTMDQHCLL